MNDKPREALLDPTRVVRATRYSVAGLGAAWREEGAFRLEAVLACVLLPLAWWVGRGWLEIALLSACVMLVLIVELLNSAIEAVVDRVSLERHPLAGRAKDLGSAAVMGALLLCGLVWGLALWQRFA
jgi:diacylglycerol kinase (ATP)